MSSIWLKFGAKLLTQMLLRTALSFVALEKVRLNSSLGNAFSYFALDVSFRSYRPIGRISEKVSPHWLRHAHASHALERGAPIHLVQATLGHATLATTGRYLHAMPSDSSARYLPREK